MTFEQFICPFKNGIREKTTYGGGDPIYCNENCTLLERESGRCAFAIIAESLANLADLKLEERNASAASNPTKPFI